MNKNRNRAFPVLVLCCMVVFFATMAMGQSQSSGDALDRGFQNPPDSAKPRAWWHWLNGNVTQEGITADLEWMKGSGIAGMQMFDGSLGTPQFVDKRLVWMTPEWKDALRHAGTEADRLGLEMAMAASGGWSETAGPWVKPEEAMKKIVWSETLVEGPKKFSGVLAHPPTNNGKFQNIPMPPELNFPTTPGLPGEKPMPPAPPPKPDPTFYADSKVIAYRLPAGEVRMADLHPKVTSSAPDVDLTLLTDGDVSKPVALRVNNGESQVWIQFEFPQSYPAEAVTVVAASVAMFGGGAIPDGEVQSSNDGTNWLTLVNLPGPAQTTGGFPVQTYSFPETAARFYRVVLRPPAPNPFVVSIAKELGFPIPSGRSVNLAEIEFSGPRVNHWQGKAAYGNTTEFQTIATPRVPKTEAMAPTDVIDVTSKMQPDGTLDWDVPAGKWVILRMGYSLTGEKNHPASPEATGYEVDKLSAKHVGDYVKTYVDMVSGALGPNFGKSFRYFLMDSWEAGVENWTDDMIPEFQKRRGYDPTPYLPVLTGRIVGSAEASDRFLWDFRRTIADLLAENHYGVATKYFNQHGVGLYAEAMGADDPTTGDGLLNKSEVDVPMGEFWTPPLGQKDGPQHPADLLEAASAAHIYGKKIAAAESFTTAPNAPVWASPFYLKPLGDKAMALGINRFVFHTSDHQPFVDDQHKPGMTLGFFGQHYTRNTTWAAEAIAWNTYLARASFLLQQGQFVGDLAYFYGESAPATVPFWKQLNPAPPQGYAYDWVNADVLLNRMSVRDGRLVLPDGMSYSALVLPDYVNQVTLPVLVKLRDLVSAGAIVVAPRPAHSPSLADDAKAAEFRSIVNEVWGGIDGMGLREHDYGKGKVYWGRPLDEVLAEQKTPADFEYNRPEFDSELVWIHRHDGDREIYFVANQKERPEEVNTSFRIAGKEAELWHPDTGLIEPAEYTIANGRTSVPLRLDPYGSVFVVFRHPASSPSRTLPHPVSTPLTAVQGPWQASFPPNWGAPPRVTFDDLVSWTDYPDLGVKYFSGTATYAKDITVPQEWFKPGARLILDLGTVKEIAEVSVNGRPVGGILWKPPFTADVTSALRPGNNHLEVKITNLWPNRIIGDRQPTATKKYAWLDYKPFRADTPLLESGLLGPVKLLAVAMK
ncbi:MAG TPA: glycosyl hydrolase [Terriglobia bacterium]